MKLLNISQRSYERYLGQQKAEKEYHSVDNESLVLQFQRARDNTDRRQLLGELYQQNDGLIGMVARKYRGYECVADLKQEAYFGLATAAERWTPDGGSTFASFAYEWIRSALQRYVEDSGCIIRIPAHRNEKIIQLRKFRSQYESDHGIPPTDQVIIDGLGVTAEQLEKIKRADMIMTVRSFSEVVGGDENSILLEDTIADPDDCIEAAEEKIQQDQLKAMIWPMVNDLDARQAAVIRKRFKENKSLKECGIDLGVSLDRARQIEAKALRMLRRSDRTKRLKPFYEDSERYSRGLKGSGLRNFRLNGESSTERAALHFAEREEKQIAAGTSHVVLDREYTDDEVMKMIENLWKKTEAFRIELEGLDKNSL